MSSWVRKVLFTNTNTHLCIVWTEDVAKTALIPPYCTSEMMCSVYGYSAFPSSDIVVAHILYVWLHLKPAGHVAHRTSVLPVLT